MSTCSKVTSLCVCSVVCLHYCHGALLPLPLTSLTLQLYPALCYPMDRSPPGSSVHGILQARILEWVAVPSSRASSWPGDRTRLSHRHLHWQAGSAPLTPPGKPHLVCVWRVLSAQSCLTLWDPVNWSPPGSPPCGDSPGKNPGVGGCALLQGISPTQGTQGSTLQGHSLRNHFSLPPGLRC